jgi:hypothetical protein
MDKKQELRAKALEIAVAIMGGTTSDISEDGHESSEIIREYLPLAKHLENYIQTGRLP